MTTRTRFAIFASLVFSIVGFLNQSASAQGAYYDPIYDHLFVWGSFSSGSDIVVADVMNYVTCIVDGQYYPLDDGFGNLVTTNQVKEVIVNGYGGADYVDLSLMGLSGSWANCDYIDVATRGGNDDIDGATSSLNHATVWIEGGAGSDSFMDMGHSDTTFNQ